jgi:hypothetical protein
MFKKASARSFFSLAFSLSNPFRRLAFEPAVRGLSAVARFNDPVLAGQIGRLHPGLVPHEPWRLRMLLPVRNPSLTFGARAPAAITFAMV